MVAIVPSLWQEVGIVGIFGLMLLGVMRPMVMGLINKRRNGNGKFSNGGWDKYDRLKLIDVHEWLKPDRETGRFPMYDRTDEVVSALKDVRVTIEKQTAILQTFIAAAPCQREKEKRNV